MPRLDTASPDALHPWIIYRIGRNKQCFKLVLCFLVHSILWNFAEEVMLGAARAFPVFPQESSVSRM
ncbi:unnamed protein product, partial [Larinioides sclopetarius]